MNCCGILALVVCYFLDFIAFSGSVNGQDVTPGSVTVCKPNYGYPQFCPQPGDSPEHTKCCRHYYKPKCCKERATKVCAGKPNSKTGKSNWDPDLSWVAVWCPQDDQPDDYTACKYNNGQVGCMSYKIIIAIIVGVFGAIFLILLSIGIGCFICYKKGKIACVKVRPGKWNVVRVSKQQQQQQHGQGKQHYGQDVQHYGQDKQHRQNNHPPPQRSQYI